MEALKTYNFKNEIYWYDENKIWEDTLNEKEFEDKCKLVMGSNFYKKMKNDMSDFGFNPRYDEERIDELMNILPKELYQNMVEWINEEPISNIIIKDVTINDIINYINLPNLDKRWFNCYFYRYLIIISKYNNGTYKDKNEVLHEAFNTVYKN